MRYVEFGTQARQLSEIMLGSMRIGDMTTDEVTKLLHAAHEAGINAIDTADIYGHDRGGEEILGEVFAANPSLREHFFIETKCGITSTSEGIRCRDYSKEHILKAVDESLEHMRIDHIDCLLLHRTDVLMVPEEVAEAFQILHDSGKVLDFGVSNQNPAQMALVEKYSPFPIVTNQVQLSLAHAPIYDAALHVNIEEDASIMRDGGIFEHCYMQGMAIQVWSPLQYGASEGTFLGKKRYAKLNHTLERIAEERGVSPSAVALAWVLRHPAKMQAVIGTTKPGHVLAAARACDFELTRAEWYELYAASGKMLP